MIHISNRPAPDDPVAEKKIELLNILRELVVGTESRTNLEPILEAGVAELQGLGAGDEQIRHYVASAVAIIASVRGGQQTSY